MSKHQPLSTDPATQQIAFLESAPHPKFLVVYASPREADGLSWCGDCRRAGPLIEKAFAEKMGLEGRGSVRVVMAGSESEWRTPTNPYRKSPFLLTALPTIIKVTEHADEGNCCVDGQCGIDEEAEETVWTRLVEGDCCDEGKLEGFLRTVGEDRR
ncbi:hypothetical protein EG328_008286 [Venturia inaequalis]|uniref:Thioredoxin domain-containing protein n=1 Tax=Venturia inaequalis TaxID=5025 RepID=A0A8H3UD57_VENIN|nr:hypothetical protein EG328_008286 [Venturia inaequalis]